MDLGGDLKRAFRRTPAMVMTIMVIIIPPPPPPPVAARVIPTIDEVFPATRAMAATEGCWRLGES